MKGQLYKEANIWMIEYEDISFRKKIIKQIELHPDDAANVVDDGKYINDYELRPVNFEIVLISDENNKAKLVAKLTTNDFPKIEIKKDDDEVSQPQFKKQKQEEEKKCRQLNQKKKFKVNDLITLLGL